MQEAQGTVLPTISSLVFGHDLNAASHSGVSPELAGTTSSPEDVNERGSNPAVSYVNQSGLSEKQNGVAHQTGKGAIEGEFSSVIHKPTRVQEENGSSFLDSRVESARLNPSFSQEIEKDSNPEHNSEGSTSPHITYPLGASSYGVTVVFGLESEKLSSVLEKVEDQEEQVFENKMELITGFAVCLDPPQESQDVGSVSCDKFKGATSLKKNIEKTSSSQDILVNDKLHLEPDERTSMGGIDHSLLEDRSSMDECHGKYQEKVVSFKEITVDAHKDGFSSAQMYKMMGSSIAEHLELDEVPMDVISAVELESVKKHLYLSYITEDILHLLLDEQTQQNEYLHLHSSHEVDRLFDLVKGAQESKEILNKELVQCKSELQLLSIVKDEIENNCLSIRMEMEQEHIKCCNLKSELHNSQEASLHFSKELATYRDSLDALQKENSTLLENTILETDAKKELVEEVEILSREQMKLTAVLMVEGDARKKVADERAILCSENMILLTEFKAKEKTLQIILERNEKLQDSLRDLNSCIEQLIEDNVYLSYSLDLHKAKLKEIGSRMFDSSYLGQEGQNADEALTNHTADMPHTLYEGPNLEVSSSIILKSLFLSPEEVALFHKDDGKVSDSCTWLKVLMEELQQAKSNLQDLEKSIQGMQSHSVSLSESGGIATTAGVSKLIKAFESKANHIGIREDELPFTVNERPEDSYAIAIQQMSSLSRALIRMELELEKADIHLMDNQHNGEILKKFNMGFESQKHLTNSLSVAFDGLAKKVVKYEHQIYEMLNNIDEFDQHVNEKVVGFLSQVESLKREVGEDFFRFKQERDGTVSMILEAVERLDASTGLKVFEDLDIRSHFMASVDTATFLIEKQHGKFEESSQFYNKLHDSHEELNKSFMDIQGKHSLAFELLYKFYINLMELINEDQQDIGNAALNVNLDELLEPLSGMCEMVVNYLRKLLNERVYLFSRNNELNLDLSTRNQEIEELTTKLKELEFQKNIREWHESTLLVKSKEVEEVKRRCFLLANQLKERDSCKDSYVHAKSCETGVVVTNDANEAADSCSSILLLLEELVAFHLHKYEETVEDIMLSQKHLQDANMLLEVSADDCFIRLPTLLSQVVIPEVIMLREKLNFLTVSNVEKESEIEIFKEGMMKMEETLEASCHELKLKESEVEQLEQKLSSVREKLSIAVAKGKGLIVQRDSLKQALMEKNNELDNSMQELFRKESLLDELEAKIKSCSEAEKIEALESELLYIRNSATALRDSFLQKDSVLQRIEEILEDLDLPDDFHDKDILEKIEVLSRVAIGHPSSIMSDLEEKHLGEHAESDARDCAVVSANINYLLIGSNPDFVELKRRYEEIQCKFNDLAKHNDMLLNTLLERNNLVQKLEETLGRIDLPFHMLTMELEDKVEFIGKELSDVKQERDTLQLKIDNLEMSSDMLIVDIEESHKVMSELHAEVFAVKTEKQFFSESFEKLRAEYFTLSEKAVHDEQERENLLKELDDLQDRLIANAHAQLEYYKGMENNLQKLFDLVNSTLTESDKVDFLSDGTLGENLEESLKKLIDRYTAYLNKSSYGILDNEFLFNVSTPSHGKMVPEEELFDKESDLASMRLELHSAYSKLVSVQEDRDAIFVKCESLSLEIENLEMQIELLNSEKNKDMEKYQSVMFELDAMGKQIDSLQEHLTQEELKSASFKEKLNLAVRKGKGLVQQRDSLKQTIEEMNALLEQLNIKYSQQTEALISEKTLLMNQLAEMELNLQDGNQNYSRLLNALNSIDLAGDNNKNDPIQWLRIVSNIILDVRSQAVVAELEASRSKCAAELLFVELNEVQGRNVFLQNELIKMEASIAEYSAQKDESISRLEHFMSVHSVERATLAKKLEDFMSDIDQLSSSLLWSSRTLADVLRENDNLFSYVEDLKELSLEGFYSPDTSNILPSNNPKDEEISRPFSGIAKYNMRQHWDESLLLEHFAFAGQALHECMSHCTELREHISKHSEFIDKKVAHVSEIIGAVKRKKTTIKDTSESLRRDITHLESKIKEKDAKISSLYSNLTLLYEACSTSVFESVRRNLKITGNSSTFGEDFGNLGIVLKLPMYANLEGGDIHSINDYIKVMNETILSTVRDANYANDFVERTKKELNATVLALQRELQEKDIQMSEEFEELVLQKRDAEAVAKRSMADLDSSRVQVSNLEKKAEVMEADRKLLESRLSELQDVEALSKLLQERINSLASTVNAKDQEIEALTQALDVEETQIEAMERNNKNMEILVQKKVMQLETLEASHIKSMSKLSTTVIKFDELHSLSKNLLAEIEVFQSQLQQRDSEISFLRQEITRSTNNVLASQESIKKHSSQVPELLTWMNAMDSRIGGPLQFDDQEVSPIGLCIDIMKNKISPAISELEELRAAAQCKDALLKTAQRRVQDLLSKSEDFETSLHGNESLEQCQVGRASMPQSSSNSLGTSQIEQMVQRNKLFSGPVSTHVRSGCKVNNDQIAIAIDTENDGALEEEDDDKSHGFKSLTMSRVVPTAARPMMDMIDGIWVSAERLLMRQPTLRLACLMYWIALHALLASFI